MDSAAPGFSERASPDRGLVGAKPAQSGETAYPREDATRPAARKGARAANELEGGDSMGQRRNQQQAVSLSRRPREARRTALPGAGGGSKRRSLRWPATF